MMDGVKHLFVVALFVGGVRCQQTFQEVVPNDLSNPNRCYDSTIDAFFSVGSVWWRPAQCNRLSCQHSDDLAFLNINGVRCEQFTEIPPNCKLTKPNLVALFPACCPKLVCAQIPIDLEANQKPASVPVVMADIQPMNEKVNEDITDNSFVKPAMIGDNVNTLMINEKPAQVASEETGAQEAVGNLSGSIEPEEMVEEPAMVVAINPSVEVIPATLTVNVADENKPEDDSISKESMNEEVKLPATMDPEVMVEETKQPEAMGEETKVSDVMAEEIKIPGAMAEETRIPEAMAEETKIPEAMDEETKIPEAMDEETRIPEAMDKETKRPEVMDEETKQPEAIPEEINIPDATAEETKIPEAMDEDTKQPEQLEEEKPMEMEEKPLVLINEAVSVVLPEVPMAPDMAPAAAPEKLSEPIYNGGVGLGKKCGPPTYQSCSSYLECRNKICQYPIKVIPIQNSEIIDQAEKPTKMPVKEEAVAENSAEEPVKDVFAATAEKVEEIPLITEETTTVTEEKPLLPGYERHATGKYKFNKRMVTWTRAKAICDAEGTHLAVVNSDEESKVLIKMFDRYPENYWQPKYRKIVFASVGFNDMEKEGEYKTVLGEPLSSTGFQRFWRKNEPNNLGASKSRPGEDCGAIHRNGGLNDFFCSIHLPFICEQ